MKESLARAVGKVLSSQMVSTQKIGLLEFLRGCDFLTPGIGVQSKLTAQCLSLPGPLDWVLGATGYYDDGAQILMFVCCDRYVFPGRKVLSAW